MKTPFDFVKMEKHVPDEVCDLLVSSCADWQGALVLDAGENFNKKLLDETRISDVHWIENEFWKQCFLSIVRNLNYNTFDFDINTIESLQLTRYVAPNGHYEFHQDGNGYIPIKNDMVRKISISVGLNDDYEGGEFEYMVDQHPRAIQLGKGDIIIFPSYLLHRVKPVTKGTRYSLVAWTLGSPLK